MPFLTFRPPLTLLIGVLISLAALTCVATKRIPVWTFAGRPHQSAGLAKQAVLAVSLAGGGAILVISLLGRDSVGNDIVAVAAFLTLIAIFRFGFAKIPGFRKLDGTAAISWLAIALYIVVMANNLLPRTAIATQQYRIAGFQTGADILNGYGPDGLIALCAIGLGVTRTPAQALRRLGLVTSGRVDYIWFAVAMLTGYAMTFLGAHFGSYLFSLEPASCQTQISMVSAHITGHGPLIGVLTMALIPAVCEELLYRGVLQPKLGILLPGLLSSLNHTMYTCHGWPSLMQLFFLLDNVAFGLLRRWGGLYPAIIAHAAFNLNGLLDLTL